ncbi:MAG: HNH endonuclease, partial [Candidatus Muiribacteriota bacterium]
MNCWFCNNEFDPENTSIEHIILNAFGGKLKGHTLCNECNEEFGKTIDKDFSKMLSFITSRIYDLTNERPINPCHECQVLIDNIVHDAFMREGKCILYKPYIDENNFKIYGTQKNCKNFLKQSKYQKIKEKYQIIEDCGGLQFIPINLENEGFKKSLIKMAINFAVHKKINFNIKKVVNNRKFLDLNIVFPYFPQSILEKMFEDKEIEYNTEYPIHSLKLFTVTVAERKYLFCFTELFSVFKQYVLLDDDYQGEHFVEHYAQKTVVSKEDSFKDGMWSPKDIWGACQQYDINPKLVQHKSTEELNKFFNLRYNDVKFYLNPDNIFNSFFTILMLEITNGKFDKELLNNIEFLKELDFFPKNPNYFRISKAYRETEFFLPSF